MKDFTVFQLAQLFRYASSDFNSSLGSLEVNELGEIVGDFVDRVELIFALANELHSRIFAAEIVPNDF